MGESTKAFLDSSKAESMVGFLDEVRKVNEKYRAIVAVVDNFQSHKSKLVKEKAEEWDIYLVYLPPYSPDLNPIEYIWRSIKRVLSLAFVESLGEIKRIKEIPGTSFPRGWVMPRAG
jgi:putative transposase